jgi:hypothetical protein
MRTTLDIDDDVLSAAKELAAEKKSTAGKVLSELARCALLGPEPESQPVYRGGFRLLPRTGKLITSEMVEKWLNEDE